MTGQREGRLSKCEVDMTWLRKGCGCFFVFCFVFFAGAFILVWSIQDRLLDADTWVAALDRAGLFELPYELIGDGEVPGFARDLLTQGPLAALQDADLEQVARDLAPVEWLRQQVRQTLQANLDQLGQRESVDVVVSLAEVKARALGDPGERALERVIASLPLCQSGQTPFQLSPDIPLCRPPDVEPSLFGSTLKTYLTLYVERLPDRWRVGVGSRDRQITRDLRRVGKALNWLEARLPLALALALGSLLLAWLLAVRSPGQWLRWTGGPLLLLGLVTSLVAVLVPPVIAWQVEGGRFWPDSDLPARLRQAASQVPADLASVLFQFTLLVGVVIVVMGGVLVVVSFFFPK